jgi:hypothetical protein
MQWRRVGDQPENDKLWDSVRLEHLRKAIELRPARARYIKELRYNVWLADLEGFREVFRKIWPHLHAARIGIGHRRYTIRSRQEDLVKQNNRCPCDLSPASALRDIHVEVEDDMRLLNCILQYTPNVERLSVEGRGYESDDDEDEAGSVVDLAKRPSMDVPPLERLTAIDIRDADSRCTPYIAGLIGRAYNLKTLRIEGSLVFQSQQAANHIEHITVALRQCIQLSALYWLVSDLSLSDLFGYWEKQGGELPRLVECVYAQKRGERGFTFDVREVLYALGRG